MEKIIILALFFSMNLYSADLKSGFYRAEHKNSTLSEKIVPCEELEKNDIMRRYKCGNLKIFKDGKTAFLEIKSYMDTGNFIQTSVGTYFIELTEQQEGIYYGKNNYIDFYVKKISKEELELTIVSRIKYSSIEFPTHSGAYVLEGSESMTFRYISKVIKNNKTQSEELTRIFENTAKELGINYGSYKKLKDEIYYLDKKVDNSDFESFMIYKSNVHSTMVFSDYAKDKNSIFYEGKIWKEPDYNSFQFLGESYVKDKANIYYSGKKINGADIDTFEIINWAYAKDKKYVYLKGEILKGKDPAKFKL